MRTKRTHRSGKIAIIEALESRRLLSGPSVAINYIDESGTMQPATEYDTYDAYAGVPFHVNGIDADENSTTFPEDSDPSAAIKAEWQWNFGDPTGEYNQLNGFNAAHIYNSTGTYPVTLTVTDEYGTPSTDTIYVDVGVAPFDPSSPDYKGTFYVAANESGVHSGSDPADAMDLSDLQNALAIPQGEQGSISSDSQILFQAGDTFGLNVGNSSLLMINQSNMEFSRYGDSSAADPLFVNDASDGSTVTIFSVRPSASNVVFDNLDFQSAHPADGETDGNQQRGEPGYSAVIAIKAGGSNITVENCSFDSLGKGGYAIDAAIINIGEDGGSPGTNYYIDGLYAADNEASGYIDYFIWDGAASDLVAIHNNVNVDTYSTEGIVRAAPDFSSGELPSRLLFYDNTFYNYDGKVFRLAEGSDAYVYANQLENLGSRSGDDTVAWIGGAQIGSNDLESSDIFSQVIFERNNVNGTISVTSGASDIMLRNNVVIKTTSIGLALFSVDGEDKQDDFDLTDSDIYILNNTGEIEVASVYASFFQLGNIASNVTLVNNLFAVSGSDSAAPIYLTDFGNADILDSFSEVADNVWADPNSSDAVYVQENGTYANPWSYEALTDSCASIAYTLTTDCSSSNYVTADTYNLTLDIPEVPGLLYPSDALVPTVIFTVSASGSIIYSTTIDLSGGAYPLADVPLSPGDTIAIYTSESTGFFPTIRIDGVSTDVDSDGNPEHTLPTIYEGIWTMSNPANWTNVSGYEDETWWNDKLEALFGTSDIFANVSLNSGNIPISDTGTASPVDSVFDDFYGKPRPATNWTVGAVEPDLDIASEGYVYLQTTSQTVNDVTTDYLSVWNSSSATGPTVQAEPDLMIPLIGFIAADVQGLNGSDNYFTMDFGNGFFGFANDYYFVGGSGRFVDTSLALIGPASTQSVAYGVVTGAPTAAGEIGFGDVGLTFELPDGVRDVGLTPDSTSTAITFGSATGAAFIASSGVGVNLEGWDDGIISPTFTGESGADNTFVLDEGYLWAAGGSYSQNIQFASEIEYLTIYGGTGNDSLEVTPWAPSAGLISFYGNGGTDQLTMEGFSGEALLDAPAAGDPVGYIDFGVQEVGFIGVSNLIINDSGSSNTLDIYGTSGNDSIYSYNDSSTGDDAMLINSVNFEYTNIGTINLNTGGGDDTFTEGYESNGATSIYVSVYVPAGSNNVDFEGADGITSITLAGLTLGTGAIQTGITPTIAP